MPVILFVIAFVFTWFIYGQIILPIIYFFPRSIYSVIKGTARPISILASLRTVILYTILLLLIVIFFPSVFNNDYVGRSSFDIGGNIALFMLFSMDFLSKKGRGVLNSAFYNFIEKYRISK
jgi:hypothetical protein